jgi:hypothetical protein
MELSDLFDQQQLKTIENAPLYMGMRHPTWFPLYYEKQRAIDYLVHSAVRNICQESHGQSWLRDLTSRLLDQEDINNASSALAEIRAYGGLLEAGFAVTPIPRHDDATPDFYIDAGDGQVTVEVFAKHQDKEQDDILNAVHSGSGILPDSVEHNVRTSGNVSIATSIVELTPAGRPNPAKPQDSIQANMISRVCAIKQNEKQIPEDYAALLVMDFTHFGGPIGAEFLKAGQTAPIESGHRGITCGSIWYAMYGWKNAPVFEEGSHKVIRMGHDGRFRLSGNKKSKLTAILVVLADSAVLLENPWAIHRLPDRARLALCRFPWFDLSRSIADWHLGDAEKHIAISYSMIEAIDQNYLDIWSHW